ncbi:hypothetical protein [Epilithonimonas sp.]|uniref:hypothetical protein n=1 Tax=Epilithonimonas sp. TaxID=2894511 RepID=UPI00289F3DC5|nr:hypothetical protein [Epilithonimonas sp.]
MKSIFHLTITLLFLIACEKAPNPLNNSKTEVKEKTFVPVYGQKYFKYDQIDFYHIDFEESNIIELDKNKNNSKLDKLKNDIIIGNFPQNINETDFLKSMDKIGYNKKEIPKSKFSEIDKVFIDKTVDASSTCVCIAFYRDILVFKNKGKIIGIAKICFSCHQHIIIGTKINDENFGQNGDYKKLEILLNQ